MPTKLVTWTSVENIDCGCLPADVFLCVNPDKVAPQLCYDLDGLVVPAEVEPIRHTIAASLFSKVSLSPGMLCKYSFQYDDTQLASGEALNPSDVLAVLCQDCLTDFIQDAAGQEISIAEEMVAGVENLKVITQHGCQYLFLKPGPLKVLPDATAGSLTPVTEVIYPADTLSLIGGDAIETVGTAATAVTINAKLSEDAGNLLNFGNDGGINLNCLDVAGCIPGFSPFEIKADSGTAQELNPGDSLTIVGGAAISTTVAAGVSATVNLALSSDAGNKAAFGSDGNLFVAADYPSLHVESYNNSTVFSGTIPAGTGTVLSGTTQTGFAVLNNPSTTRSMDVTVIPRAQITISEVTGAPTSGIQMQMQLNSGGYSSVLSMGRDSAGAVQIGFPDPKMLTIADSGTLAVDIRAISAAEGTGNTGEYAYPSVNLIGNCV